MTKDEIRASAAIMLDNMAAVEMEDVVSAHADCYYCRAASSHAAQLRFAAGVLRDPQKLHPLPNPIPHQG